MSIINTVISDDTINAAVQVQLTDADRDFITQSLSDAQAARDAAAGDAAQVASDKGVVAANLQTTNQNAQTTATNAAATAVDRAAAELALQTINTLNGQAGDFAQAAQEAAGEADAARDLAVAVETFLNGGLPNGLYADDASALLGTADGKYAAVLGDTDIGQAFVIKQRVGAAMVEQLGHDIANYDTVTAIGNRASVLEEGPQQGPVPNGEANIRGGFRDENGNVIAGPDRFGRWRANPIDAAAEIVPVKDDVVLRLTGNDAAFLEVTKDNAVRINQTEPSGGRFAWLKRLQDGTIVESVDQQGRAIWGPRMPVDWTPFTLGVDGGRQVWVGAPGYPPIRMSDLDGADHCNPRIEGMVVTWTRIEGNNVARRSRLLSGAMPVNAALTLLEFAGDNGQSLAAGSTAYPVSTVAALLPTRAFSFRFGPRAAVFGDPIAYGIVGTDVCFEEIVPILERQEGACGETWGSQSCAAYLDTANGGRPATTAALYFNAAIGSQAYAQLKKGTAPYNNMMRAVEWGARIAGFNKLPFQANWALWSQGNGNILESGANPFPIGVYRAHMEEYQRDVTTDFRARDASGLGDVNLVMSQLSSQSMYATSPNDVRGLVLTHDQVDAAINNPGKIFVACPEYQFDHNATDGVHLGAIGKADGAFYIGRAQRRIKAGQNGNGLYFTAAVRAGTTMKLTGANLWPGRNLQIRTDRVTDPGNLGIVYRDDGNGNAIVLSNVRLVGNEVWGDLSAVPTAANPRIYVAGNITVGAHGGPTTGPRCCICDDSPDVLPASGRGAFNYALHQILPLT